MKGIARWFRNMRQELAFTVSSFLSIISGFKELQFKNRDDQWQKIEGKSHPAYPYYVCALFYSGRRMPLPFFTNLQTAKIGWLQKQAIILAGRINPGSYEAVQVECAWYVMEWQWEMQMEAEIQACYEEDSRLLGAKTLAILIKSH